MMRPTATSRDVRAGCFVCHGSEAYWWSANAQAVAANHHDRTGHPTWCDVQMTIRYGNLPADDRQTDIEDAIASASSGERPVSPPVTVFDAPAVPAADVSASEGRSSKSALAAAKPETVSP